MKKMWLAVCFLCVLGCGDLSEEANNVSPENISQSEQSVIIGTEDWTPVNLASPNTSSSYMTTEYYARAVFDLNGGCTGFMIDDNHAVTAYHCVMNQSYSYNHDVKFSPNYNTFNFVTKRLAQLGIANYDPVVSYNKLKDPYNGCKLWENWHLQSNGHRDQAVLKCDPVNLDNTYIPLGAVWGHVDTTISTIPESNSANATVLSVNSRTTYPNFDQVLWSGARISDSNSSCTLCGDLSSSSCFEHEGDTLSGSSGGAVFDRVLQTARGVNKGDSLGIVNCGTWFPPRLAVYRDQTALTSPLITDNTFNYTFWAGTSSAAAQTMECPANYVAGGILATTYNNSYVANFGIICVPYYNPPTKVIQTARYTVNATGSPDTSTAYTFNGDYNRYMHLYPKNEELHCPAHSYLSGILAARIGVGDISKIYGIQCTHYSTKAIAYRYTTEVPNGEIGAQVTGAFSNNALCPPGEVMRGAQMVRNILGRVSGFRGMCKQI